MTAYEHQIIDWTLSALADAVKAVEAGNSDTANLVLTQAKTALERIYNRSLGAAGGEVF